MRSALLSTRRLGAAALCATAVTLAAGCSSGSATSASPASSASASSKPTQPSPRQVLTLAAAQARKIHSFAASLRIQMPGNATMSGTMRSQTKPLLTESNFTISASGSACAPAPCQSLKLSEIINGTGLYVKIPALAQQLGKPWIKVSFSQLKKASGVNLSQLLRQNASDSPLSQTQMLAASKNVHKVGTTTIDGVTTTEYAGSYPASAALARLPASLRSKVKPTFNALGLQTVHFQVWLDALHQARRVIAHETGTAGEIVVHMNVTAINQPVHVTIPPASQVTSPPPGSLGG